MTRIRKDIVALKAARRFSQYTTAHEVVWHLCPMCGWNNAGDTLRSRDKHGDVRYCYHCCRSWFDRYLLHDSGLPRYRYVGSVAHEEKPVRSFWRWPRPCE